MSSPPPRDPAEEREEINLHIEEAAPERPIAGFKEGLGRIPPGPARGWRRRAQKAKSCDRCEGDLWIEKDGVVLPCPCRERRAVNRANNRLRAGNWLDGPSLSFAAPPLASLIPWEVRDAVEAICADVRAGKAPTGFWLTGGEGSGKSTLCAYIAQQLYSTNHAVVERVGDLMAHLRWLGAVRGESAVEQRLEKLIATPLLVLDDVDRAVRSHPSSVPLAFESSCASHDLIRVARLLRERHAAMKPTVVTSRAAPVDCEAHLASISPTDLVRGLLGTALGSSDPFEDFPGYSQALLNEAFGELRGNTTPYALDQAVGLAAAA